MVTLNLRTPKDPAKALLPESPDSRGRNQRRYRDISLPRTFTLEGIRQENSFFVVHL